MRGATAKGFLAGKSPRFDGLNERERGKFNAVTWHYSTAVPAGDVVRRIEDLHRCVANASAIYSTSKVELDYRQYTVDKFAACAARAQGDK